MAMRIPSDLIPAELAVDHPPISDDALDRALERFADAFPGSSPASLLDYPAGDDGPFPDADAEVSVIHRWRIEELGAAEWAMRHCAEIDGELSALTMQAGEWIRKINAWFEQATRVSVRRRQFFEAHLADYMARVRYDSDGKTKSVKLPSGTIKSTGHAAKIVVVDEATFFAWAFGSGHADLVRVKHEPAVVEIRRTLAITTADDDETVGTVVDPATGEPVLGVSIESASVSYNVVPG